MKGSLIIVAFFIVGICLGRFGEVAEWLKGEQVALYALYVLMFLVGISVGSDRKALQALKQQQWKIVFVPLGTIFGTLAGVALVSVALPGFGYYSLSSIFITQYKGAELGTIALTSNIMREILTLLCAPLMVRYFGKLAPISSGGATSMDTTLPVITRFAGKEFVIVSIFHGMTVDFCVPFLVTFFCLW